MKSMINKRQRIVGMLLLTMLSGSLKAASVSLVATSNTSDVDVGDQVTFNVMMDFSTGSGLFTLGGGFDIVFDSNAVLFTGLTSANLGDPRMGRNPDVSAGLLESWAFADFDGLVGPALVGSVQFEVLSTMGASTSIATRATNGIAGPFVSEAVFLNNLLAVDYNSLEITRSFPELMFTDGFE